METTRAFILLLFIFSIPPLSANDDLKAFPPPVPGEVRYVLQLPEQEDESLYKIQLILGKTVKTDLVNQYFLSGKIEEETIKGWGYSRYILRDVGPMAGTLMAVDPDAPQVQRFIPLAGEAYLVRYNSRLPIVVYAPEGIEVKYRIWSASEQAISMDVK